MGEDVYNEKRKLSDIEYQKMDELTKKMEELQTKFVKLENENEERKSSEKRLRSELEENEQKMEEYELRIITLQNETNQLQEIYKEHKNKINSQEIKLNDKNMEIVALNKSMVNLENGLNENGCNEHKLRMRYQQIEEMYNKILIRNQSLEQHIDHITKDKESMQNKLNSLQIQCDKMKKLNDRNSKVENMKNIQSEIQTPKEIQIQIKTEILEQELYDEQKETKRLKGIIDELKIKNAKISQDLHKTEVDNNNLLEIQNMRTKNNKLTKKIKMQQAKIEMFKKN